MQSIIVHWRAKPCRHFIEHAVGAIPAHCGALPSVQCGAEGGQGEARKLCSAITGRLLLRGTDTATLALYRKTARSWHPCLPASRSGGAPGRHCHHGCAPSPSVAPLLPLPVALARASARVHGWRVGLRLRAAAAAAAALAVSRLCRCSMPPPLQWPSCRGARPRRAGYMPRARAWAHAPDLGRAMPLATAPGRHQQRGKRRVDAGMRGCGEDREAAIQRAREES
jgi:hypothetical protein